MKSPHLDPEWLRQKYESEGLSTYAIGAIVGRNPKNVHDALVRFGIPRRPKWCRIATDANSSLVAPRRGWRHTEEARQKCIEAARTPHPSMRGDGNPMHGRRGPLHPNFLGGSTPERQRVYASAEWAAVVRDVLARDGYRCVRCGSGNTRKTHRGRSLLHAHHVKGWAAHPDLRLDPGNIVTMCATCHRWTHSRKNTDRLWLA